MWRLRLTLIAAVVPLTGCMGLIGNYTPVEIQVVEPRANFIDRALGHRYSDWYSIAGARVSPFGAHIPVWRVVEQANRRVSDDGPERTMAYLRGEGCESTGERSCAYRKMLRKLELDDRQETERRLMTLHFTLSPDAAKGCNRCVDVRLEIEGTTARDN